ncbi:MAG TPA: nuclear transport factor 2 family protein [Ktedonobacterales bacterium]
MTEQSTSTATARAFTEAWTSHDMRTAASYLAEDVVFDGPANRSQGVAANLEGLNTFAQAVTGLRILAVHGNDDQALIMYEVTMGPRGVVRGAELLTFRDGKIAEDKLVFVPLQTPAAQ